jgi:glycosyltransferase involved in cell wall biosynthesis
VFPSVWHEAFGMPPAEAMACAKPVVATYSGGIPEFVKDGENGRLVDRGDVKALAAALIELARDPAQREYLGRNAREFVEKNLTWEHISQTLLREIALRQPDTVPSTATWSR